MDISPESAYSDGFVDGQEDILDQIIDIADSEETFVERYAAIMDMVDEKKREIDSL